MPTLVAEPLSNVRPEAVRWLWEPYLPRGKLTVLDGDPGVGKSLVTIDLAARLSRAGRLPGGALVERQHTVLLLSAEDAAADTTRPRAEAAGAVLDRVSVVSASGGAPLYFPAQLTELGELIESSRADLVVIDPLMAFLPPEVSANLDQCVRTVLTPLAALAERTDCTVLLVRHLRKKGAARAVHRGQGSAGIIGAARTGLLAACHPSDPELRVLAVTKSNVAVTPPSLTYRVLASVSGPPVVEWGTAAELSADELGKRVEAPLRPRDRASSWLRAELAAGPRRATDVVAAAVAEGIPDATLDRAKQAGGVKSHRVYGRDTSVWYWYDPESAWPADAPFKKPTPGTLPPLEDLF